MHSLSIGTKVKHPQYGVGVVLDNQHSFYNIAFPNIGEKTISKDSEEIELVELAPLPDQRLSLGDVEQVLTQILRTWTDISEPIKLGKKWEGGTMILKPSNDSLKSKEIPIETFFHKIVMVRDRLRVLEQNLNKSKNLSDEEKVNMQQYITRIYGSLTTFNVLFEFKEDAFKGESKS
ncbi:hypothetical protein [Pontibacter sp. G13]|uniref:hypothetical protein n=1 Tax=Pontibacter sp. G13 TaxID=3074898 RepID=UPI00288938A6|nr:hypothetical protein [Pontibacter sp. G13]WNJ16226.1 hypothetical protein RJD25_15285 [Pontibacter sp. G13]